MCYVYLVPRLSSFYPRKNALIRTVIIDYLFLTTARLGYNDDDKCKQRGDPASNGALLANAFSSGIGVMVSGFPVHISMETESLHKNKKAQHQ